MYSAGDWTTFSLRRLMCHVAIECSIVGLVYLLSVSYCIIVGDIVLGFGTIFLHCIYISIFCFSFSFASAIVDLVAHVEVPYV